MAIMRLEPGEQCSYVFPHSLILIVTIVTISHNKQDMNTWMSFEIQTLSSIPSSNLPMAYIVDSKIHQRYVFVAKYKLDNQRRNILKV